MVVCALNCQHQDSVPCAQCNNYTDVQSYCSEHWRKFHNAPLQYAWKLCTELNLIMGNGFKYFCLHIIINIIILLTTWRGENIYKDTSGFSEHRSQTSMFRSWSCLSMVPVWQCAAVIYLVLLQGHILHIV